MLNKLFTLALVAPIYYVQAQDEAAVDETAPPAEAEEVVVAPEPVDVSELTQWQKWKLESPTGPINEAVATNGDRANECFVL